MGHPSYDKKINQLKNLFLARVTELRWKVKIHEGSLVRNTTVTITVPIEKLDY
jgi:hypothetical protein